MRALIAFVLLLVAGCVAPGAGVTPQDAALARDVVPAFPQEHDHLDPALHDAAQGLALVGSHTLTDVADATAPHGDWMTSEIIVKGDYAFITYLGAPWLLAIVDVRDAAAPKLVAQWSTANAWGMDLAADDVGDFVYVAVYPNAVGDVFTPGYTLGHLGAPDGINAPGIAVVDVRDKAHPTLSSFLPMHPLGPHTVGYHRYPDGREVVFGNHADVQVGNAVEITEVVDLPTGGKALRPLSYWWLDSPLATDQPHDVDAAEHPITGQTLLYVAYTFAGVAIVDITDPSQPTLVSRTQTMEGTPDELVHDIHPYPQLVDGRHYTVAAPEIITGDTSGTLRFYDTTDPAAPVMVGTWEMPGEYVTAEAFGFSTHNFVFMPDGRIALAHGHAGVWLVDWLTSRGASPVATAYYDAAFPDAAPPAWAPVHGTPWYWGTGVDARGVLWANDIMGGLVSLGPT
ncbi:MAG TPA: hypothetical protein VM370_02210 [Candidatus Thermoplasmatota archaeon]|nr:hypothetical protein [Candidatus Thermoplasmatota archaeon]